MKREDKTQKTTTGLNLRTNVRAGGFSSNHNQHLKSGLKVRTNVRAGLARPIYKPTFTAV